MDIDESLALFTKENGDNEQSIKRVQGEVSDMK